jgi:hypothetical protein
MPPILDERAEKPSHLLDGAQAIQAAMGAPVPIGGATNFSFQQF